MSEHRNVVLVTIDSLRADCCEFMGNDRNTTPALDAMSRDGLVFENAIAPGPSTYESMPAVFTGRAMTEYPGGEGDALDARNRLIRLNTRRPTIPAWFAERGYDAAAFTTNPYTGAHTNFARGFDRFEDFLEDGEGPLMRRAAHVPVLSEVKHLVTLVRGDRASKPWRSYYDDVLAWVQQSEKPYFLWVFALDAHTPYLVPDRHRDGGRLGMYYHNWLFWASQKWGLDIAPDSDALRRLYDGTVRSVDALLGRLRRDLSGTDPVLVVHADHGEAFGEHGTYGHEPQLYEENIHVPLVIHNAATTGTVERPTSLTALPRLLREAATDSLSPPETDYALSRTLGPRHIAIRGTDWKYIGAIDPDARAVIGEEFYDLSADPTERENRADEHTADIASCRALVRRRLAHEHEAATVYRAATAVDG